MAREVLGHRVHDEVGAEGERLLEQGSGEGVVDDDEEHRAREPRAASTSTSATSSSGFVGDSSQSIAAPSRAPTTASVSVTSTGRDDDLAGLGAVGQRHEGAVVGRRRHDDAATVGDERERRRHGRHAGGEHEGVAALERAERLLERRPGRVADAGVARRPVGVVGRASASAVRPPAHRARAAPDRGRRGGWRGSGRRVPRGRAYAACPRLRDRVSGDGHREHAQRRPRRPGPDGAPRRLRVALVFGGRSSEHAVSCATAASVMSAMDPERYEVHPDRDRQGRQLGARPQRPRAAAARARARPRGRPVRPCVSSSRRARRPATSSSRRPAPPPRELQRRRRRLPAAPRPVR